MDEILNEKKKAPAVKKKGPKEHRVHVTHFDPFAIGGGRKRTSKFRVEAPSKKAAIDKLQNHLQTRNHRDITVKYKGLVKEDAEAPMSKHRIRATFSIQHDRDVNVHGGTGAVVAKQAFNVNARSKAHAISKVSAHLQRNGAKNIHLRYVGNMNEAVGEEAHKVYARYSYPNRKNPKFTEHGSDVFKVKKSEASTPEEAVAFVKKGLSKWATVHKVEHRGYGKRRLGEGFDYGHVDTAHTISATYEHDGKTKKSEHRVNARTVKAAHDIVGTELHKAGATNIRTVHKGSSAAFRPKPSTKLQGGSNDNKRPKVIDLAAVRARLGKT